MNFSLESSNPALQAEGVSGPSAFEQAMSPSNTASLQGVANKTFMLCAIAIAAGAGGYSLVSIMPSIMWISAIASLIIAFGIYFVLAGKPHLAPIVAPIYAVVEGVFLGAFTGALDSILANMGYQVAGGLALQAFIITVSCLLAMLGLYSAGILRPTRKFVATIVTLTGAVMIIYLISFVMLFFGVRLPFITIGSALQGGTPALIGLGLNVAILALASLWLIIDFGKVEEIVNSGSPKNMEWYAGFALLVTLAWIYFEAVKLAFRLAIMFGNRD